MKLRETRETAIRKLRDKLEVSTYERVVCLDYAISVLEMKLKKYLTPQENKLYDTAFYKN
jgi:hypothetical protein